MKRAALTALALIMSMLACLSVGVLGVLANQNYSPAAPDYSTTADKTICPTEDSCYWGQVAFMKYDWIPTTP